MKQCNGESKPAKKNEQWEKRWGGQFDLLKVLIEPLLEVEATASGKKKTLQRLEDAIGEGSVGGGSSGWAVDWGGEIFVVLTAVNMVIKVKDDIREKEKVKSKLICLIIMQFR